jgi:hypothetical protein
MRKYFATVLLIAAAACSTTAKSGSSSITINTNQVPSAVQGAFYSQHPYAQMTKPIQQTTDNDNQTIYIIPYSRTDGTKAIATYTSMGVLEQDQ